MRLMHDFFGQFLGYTLLHKAYFSDTSCLLLGLVVRSLWSAQISALERPISHFLGPVNWTCCFRNRLATFSINVGPFTLFSSCLQRRR